MELTDHPPPSCDCTAVGQRETRCHGIDNKIKKPSPYRTGAALLTYSRHLAARLHLLLLPPLRHHATLTVTIALLAVTAVPHNKRLRETIKSSVQLGCRISTVVAVQNSLQTKLDDIRTLVGKINFRHLLEIFR